MQKSRCAVEFQGVKRLFNQERPQDYLCTKTKKLQKTAAILEKPSESRNRKKRRKSKALFCDLSDFYLLIDILYLENINRKQELIVISICIYETIRKRLL